MSKYLDWYSSSLDPTPTEKMAKDEIESAHRKINHATEALAKANGRVKKLESIAKGLCHAEGSVRGDKAYAEWCEYQEQLHKGKSDATSNSKYINASD